MKRSFFFKKNNNQKNKEKNQKWWQKILWFLLLTLLVISFLRITLIGVIIDDILFEFLWGGLKYFLVLIFVILIINKIFNNYFLSFFKKKKWLIGKRKIIKIGWFFFNIILLLGLIDIIILNEGWTWNYQKNILHKIIPEKYTWENLEKKWSWLGYENIDQYWDNFFISFENLIPSEDFGGFIGLISASLFCYFHIIGAFIGWLISFLLMISYSINNSCLYYFYSKIKKEKIKWKNLNLKNDYRIKTNIINKINDQDMTIEIQKAQKIHDHDQNFNLKNIDETSNILEKKEQENVFQEQIIIEHKNENVDNLFLEQIKKESEAKIVDDFDQKNNVKQEKNFEINNQKKIYQEHLPTFDIFEKEEDSLIYATKIHKNKEIEKWKWRYQEKITSLFKNHNVQAKINNVIIGPRVIRFEIFLFPGIKVQNILSLEPELKLILANKNIFLETVSGGKSLIGIDVPIPDEFVIIIDWKETIKKTFNNNFQLPLTFGKNSMNEVEIFDLNKLPHLLIAGRTGGGKSVCLTSIIATLIYHKTPLQLKLLLIDPKRVELSIFKNLPHLLGPIITKTNLVAKALENIIQEIEKRFQLFERISVRDLDQYNQKMSKKDRLPYLVIVIDELADLILRYRKEIEDKIVRICQIARAAGVHMILATQRPSVNIITALIKANIPGRIAFSVTNNFDSRTIINSNGAEKLLGIGDMIFVNLGKTQQRIQGSYIKINDINALNDYWKNIYTKENYFWPQFLEENLIENDQNQNQSYLNFNEHDQKMYQEIKQYVSRLEKISVSLLQRRFNIGFNRASKMLEKLESENLISKANGNKPRNVLKDSFY